MSKLMDIASEEIKMEMTPMIDVTFLLLIFFLCTIKFKLLEGKLAAYLPKDVGVNSSQADPKDMLGGAQSIHTNSYDEVFATPTESALKVALRTQQIIQEESEITRWADPLGGSWLIEELTDRLEREAMQEIKAIDQLGGIEKAIELYYPQRAIHGSARRDQSDVESGEQKIVGVDVYMDPRQEAVGEPGFMEEIRARRGMEQRQIERLLRVKSQRCGPEVEAALQDLNADAIFPRQRQSWLHHRSRQLAGKRLLRRV